MDHGGSDERSEAIRAVGRVEAQIRRSASETTQMWALKIDDLAIASGFKAKALLRRARHHARVQKALNLGCGVMALLSGASISAVVSDLVSSMTIKVLSAVGALLSGTITLVSNGYFNDQDTQKMLDAAARFMALERKANVERDHPGLTKLQAFELTHGLMTEFTAISTTADRYLISELADVTTQTSSRNH